MKTRRVRKEWIGMVAGGFVFVLLPPQLLAWLCEQVQAVGKKCPDACRVASVFLVDSIEWVCK